jgi:hypothetical protein
MSRRLLAPLGLACCVLAACGSNMPAPSPSPTPAPTLAPGTDTYPQQDTPISQAPPAMAATWRPYGVDVIPGHDTVDPSAKWPHAVDATGGALDSSQVDAVAAAVMRVQVLASWGDEHDQPALEAHMMNAPFLLGSTGVALAEGTRVHQADCSTYPVALAVHAPSPQVRDALVRSGQNIGSGAIPVVMAFAGPCPVTGTTRDGRSVDLDTLPPSVVVVMVELQDDPVLGPIAHLDGAGACPAAPVAPLCPSR